MEKKKKENRVYSLKEAVEKLFKERYDGRYILYIDHESYALITNKYCSKVFKVCYLVLWDFLINSDLDSSMYGEFNVVEENREKDCGYEVKKSTEEMVEVLPSEKDFVAASHRLKGETGIDVIQHEYTLVVVKIYDCVVTVAYRDGYLYNTIIDGPNTYTSTERWNGRLNVIYDLRDSIIEGQDREYLKSIDNRSIKKSEPIETNPCAEIPCGVTHSFPNTGIKDGTKYLHLSIADYNNSIKELKSRLKGKAQSCHKFKSNNDYSETMDLFVVGDVVLECIYKQRKGALKDELVVSLSNKEEYEMKFRQKIFALSGKPTIIDVISAILVVDEKDFDFDEWYERLQNYFVRNKLEILS